MNSPAIDPSAQVALGLTSLAVAIVLYVWVGLALSRVFRKSGVEGWKAWVPVLNTIVLLQLGGFSGWLILLAFIPPALLVVEIIAYHRINLSFGHGGGMTVLAVLLFPVWASVLGFGASRWVGRETTAAGPVRSSAPAPTGAAWDAAGQAPRGAAPGAPGSAPYRSVTPPPAYGGARPAPAGPRPTGAPYGPPALAAPPAGWAPQPGPQRPPAVPPVTAAPTGAPASAPPAPPTPVAGAAGPLRQAPAAPRSAPASARPVSAQPPAPVPAQAGPVDPGPVAASGPVSAAPAIPPIPPSPAAGSEPAPTQPVPFPDDAPGPVRGRRSAPIYDDDELEAEQDGVAEPQAWTLPTEVTSEVTAAEPGAPGPIAAVPSSSAAPVGPVSAVPPVTRVPAPVAPPEREPWAPALSPTPEGDAFPETSGAVSAIVGAPDAGAPRSALASVSALHPRPHVPDDEDIFDETVVTRRKRTPWTLVPPSGRSIPITSDVVILGRRPGADPAFPDAQLVAIDDDTRTVSKTHARLELRDDAWTIVDLDSTNGVLLTDAAGAEVEAAPGVGSRVGERFLLGDAELRLERSEA